MGRLKTEHVAVSRDGDQVAFRIEGRAGSFRMDAADALALSNALGNAAVDALGDDIGSIPLVQNVHLRPFSSSGLALLRFATVHGPLTIAVDHHWLGALAAAAEAALELGEAAGNA